MYGLAWAGIWLKNSSVKDLASMLLVPGPWSHMWQSIQLALVVDDIAMKYIGQEHAEHLMSILKKHYESIPGLGGNRIYYTFLSQGLQPIGDHIMRI